MVFSVFTDLYDRHTSPQKKPSVTLSIISLSPPPTHPSALNNHKSIFSTDFHSMGMESYNMWSFVMGFSHLA